MSTWLGSSRQESNDNLWVSMEYEQHMKPPSISNAFLSGVTHFKRMSTTENGVHTLPGKTFFLDARTQNLVCTHACMDVCMQVCIYLSTYVIIYILYIYTYTCICIYTCISILRVFNALPPSCALTYMLRVCSKIKALFRPTGDDAEIKNQCTFPRMLP